MYSVQVYRYKCTRVQLWKQKSGASFHYQSPWVAIALGCASSPGPFNEAAGSDPAGQRACASEGGARGVAASAAMGKSARSKARRDVAAHLQLDVPSFGGTWVDAPVSATPPRGDAAQGSAGVERRKRKRKRKGERAPRDDRNAPAGPSGSKSEDAAPRTAGATQHAKGGGVLDRLRQRLHGSHFRWLNERLYTCTGDEAYALMHTEGAAPADAAELFEAYHAGFRVQTAHWPVRPIDVAIAWLRARPKLREVADFGCGDAELAQVLGSPSDDGAPMAATPAAGHRTIHSFDLVATSPRVTACNMACVPLAARSVDCCVFCLALMGTDYPSFLAEAARVLRPGGWLWIAEVRSRFSNVKGGDKARSAFVACVERGLAAGSFTLRHHDASNTMFVTFAFQMDREKAAATAQSEEGKGKRGKAKENGKGKGERRTKRGDGANDGAPAWPALTSCKYKKN